MKTNHIAPPLKKNDEPTLEIESLTNEGQGVAHVEGYAVFVIGALPDERVKAHVIKVEPSYAIAKTVEILVSSPERRAPVCPVFDRCGGCALMHLSYDEQLKHKRQWVTDALTRLGGFVEPRVNEVIGMDAPYRYRNKGSFPFGVESGATVFGFYAERSHRLVPFSDCEIQSEQVIAAARAVGVWADENGVSVYDETTGRGFLRAVVARVSSEGELMVVVVARGPLKKTDALVSALEDAESVYLNINEKETNVVFGERFILLSGKPAITETIGSKRFLVGPQSFLQVNPTQTEALYEAALSLINPRAGETIVDAYCGVGTISLMLSDQCGRVIGVEQVAAAIADAKENARQNGVSNAAFVCGDVENVLPQLVADGEKIDAIVLDPPRKGCVEAALRAVVQSGATRVAYVSCNPATLARDGKYLAAHGFILKAVQPVDMFPQTVHVETVCLMSRVKGK